VERLAAAADQRRRGARALQDLAFDRLVGLVAR
jgi:hypothetical protein